MAAKTPDVPTPEDAGLQPCPVCDTSGFIREVLVPKRLLNEAQHDLQNAASAFQGLQDAMRRERSKDIKAVLIALIIGATLSFGGWVLNRYLKDQAAVAASLVEAERQEDLAHQEKREKERNAERQKWEECLNKPGTEKCSCMEMINSSVDTSRCWRDAAMAASRNR